MTVQRGATPTERVADGSAKQALADYRPTVLVLQERGGDLMCLPKEEACRQSRLRRYRPWPKQATRQARRVVLLGSYQPHPRASAAMVEKNGAAAKRRPASPTSRFPRPCADFPAK